MWIKTITGLIFKVNHYDTRNRAYVVYTNEEDLITGRNLVQMIDYTAVEKMAETKEEL